MYIGYVKTDNGFDYYDCYCGEGAGRRYLLTIRICSSYLKDDEISLKYKLIDRLLDELKKTVNVQLST